VNGDPWVVLPLTWLLAGAFALGLIGRLWQVRNATMAALTAALCLSGLGMLWPSLTHARAAVQAGAPVPTWGAGAPESLLLRASPVAVILAGLSLGLGACTAIYSGRYMDRDARYVTYYPLLLVMLSGLIGMLFTTDLFNLYLFCELMSVPTYILVAFRRHTDTAVEAGFKYLVLGSVATMTMLLGVALVYRGTGQLTLPHPTAIRDPWGRAGTACLLIGLGLKSGIVPLHTWLPDAYGRAPSSVSALLAGVVSKSTLVVLLQVCLGLGLPARELGLLLIGLSFLNMTVGNAMALVQRHTKRLLAYSSIAQGGYIMFAIGVGLRYALPGALEAGFFLLLTHALLKGIAFLSKGVCHFYNDVTLIEQLRGTWAQLPLAALTFSLALAGLAGIPPLAGFAAKWFILASSLPARDGLVYAGTVIFLLNSLSALGYYLPLIVRLFIPPQEHQPRLSISGWMATPLLALSGLTLLLSFLPGLGLRFTQWFTHVRTW
jgi:proton-translocating NADH-quinone oxidoreductase chain N